MNKKTAIVAGAGIAGLAMARALSLKGYNVKVFDRSGFAIGASVRNFGMIWPIGQADGLYETAVRSRDIWRELGDKKAFWYRNTGSLHLAYEVDEWKVLNEAYDVFKNKRRVSLAGSKEVSVKSPAVVSNGLYGALYSEDEVIVDPREAIAGTAEYLQETMGVEFQWNTCIREVKTGCVITSDGHQHRCELIIICSGIDFETLYPDVFLTLDITKCKLQMMRFVSQNGWDIGPALCGGLSLIHYKSFSCTASLSELKNRYASELPQYLEYGIHVMVSQNGKGELTVGDSHQYGLTHDPFDQQLINDLILRYLGTFARFKDPTIIQTWNGLYPKLVGDRPYIFMSPEPGIYLFNGLGGNGMTLGFGLAEELTESL